MVDRRDVYRKCQSTEDSDASWYAAAFTGLRCSRGYTPTANGVGYTQSGPRFHDKTRALEKAIIKAFPSSTLHYISGPLQLRPADIPGYVAPSAPDSAEDDTEYFAWWRRTEPGKLYQGMAEGLARVAETIRKEGPFDGAIGFSQGGAATGIVASLLEPGRREAFEAARTIESQKAEYPASFVKEDGEVIQDPLKFAIVYSGFAASLEHYSAYYEPKIRTPVLHFLGSLDTLVDEQRSQVLVNACEHGEERVVIHPGGHFVPTQKVWLDAAVNFIGECVNGRNESKAAQEESVEIMDVPF